MSNNKSQIEAMLIPVGRHYIGRGEGRGFYGRVLCAWTDANQPWARMEFHSWVDGEVIGERIMNGEDLRHVDLYADKRVWAREVAEIKTKAARTQS